jgi:hypothetical protein
MTHEAVQRLAHEPALVCADPRLLAKRRGEAIGHEAPVHPCALPQFEHERAQPTAVDHVRRQFLVRDSIDVRQRTSYTRNAARRERPNEMGIRSD